MVWRLVALIIAIISCDQSSKMLLMNWLTGSTHHVNSIFSLVSSWNHGISFGIMSGYNLIWLWVSISLIFSTYLFYRAVHGIGKLPPISSKSALMVYGLIIGGAVSNAIDRVRYGSVFDFIELHWKDLYWPAFNVADSAIVIGGLMILLLPSNDSLI